MTDSEWVAALILITGLAAAINRSVAWRKYQEQERERRLQEQVKRIMDLDRRLSREPPEE